MEIAESMKGTAENIIASYNVRVRALGDLVADTHKTLKGVASDRKKMAREQAESLAHFARGLSKSVEDMLKGFREDHQQMSDERKKREGGGEERRGEERERSERGERKGRRGEDEKHQGTEEGESERPAGRPRDKPE